MLSDVGVGKTAGLLVGVSGAGGLVGTGVSNAVGFGIGVGSTGGLVGTGVGSAVGLAGASVGGSVGGGGGLSVGAGAGVGGGVGFCARAGSALIKMATMTKITSNLIFMSTLPLSVQQSLACAYLRSIVAPGARCTPGLDWPIGRMLL